MSAITLKDEMERAARVALARMEKQTASGKWAAASALVKIGGEMAAGVGRPLADLPALPEPTEVRRAAWDMLRAGKISPAEAADIVRAFG